MAGGDKAGKHPETGKGPPMGAGGQAKSKACIPAGIGIIMGISTRSGLATWIDPHTETLPVKIVSVFSRYVVSMKEVQNNGNQEKETERYPTARTPFL